MSLLRADARTIPLRDGCVQTVVTSPPYWGLRTYPDANAIGLEPTPEAYVAELVAVFTEVRRVLRDDGTCWVNIGDSYGSGTWKGRQTSQTGKHGYWENSQIALRNGGPVKQLLGLPWRVAFALQADGWYLRSDIIWSKPNPMPESVTDRPTKAHEYLFLLARAERYYYDAEAIKESSIYKEGEGGHQRFGVVGGKAEIAYGARVSGEIWNSPGVRNKRSVWTIPTAPYSGAHFATFPEALVEPCILAGAPVGGLVLDPFIGSGTVGAVAERLGRRWIGLDLSYQHLAAKRTAQRGLRYGWY